MQHMKIKVNGIDLHVVDYGGQGEVILCVHGLTANSRFWDCVAERLVDEYRVIAFDLRGRGDSEKPHSGYNLRQHTEDAKEVLDALGVKKAIFMGHSLGAMIGSCFAATYPERLSHLILVDGGADFDPAVVDLLHSSIDRLEKVFPNFDTYLTQMKSSPFFKEWNHYVQQYFYFDVLHQVDGSVRSKVSKHAIQLELQALEEISINSFHEQIQAPTLVLWAPRCLLHPDAYLITREKGEELVAKIPLSRFVEVEHSNHYSIVFSSYPFVVLEVKRFLNGLISEFSVT